MAALLAAGLLGGCAAPAPAVGPPSPAASASPEATAESMSIWSPAVADGRLLTAFRCEPRVDGIEASIPLAWSGVPAGTASLAIGMSHHLDPSDPTRVSGYLELWAIPPTVTAIPAGGAGDGPWFMGANKDLVTVSYTSPCSKGKGTHEYTIELFALGATPASLPARSSLEVTYPVLVAAVATVPVLATATFTFADTTP